MQSIITANWNAPKHIKTLITTKINPSNNSHAGGFNLATHINDDPKTVANNRTILNSMLPSSPLWLNQIHSNNVLDIDSLINDAATKNIKLSTNELGDVFINSENNKQSLDFDASFSFNPNTVCAVMTADCVPILLTDTSGSFVASIHAGRMGLATNIVANTINAINKSPQTILAYIGPSVCQKHYEVGEEVFSQFMQQNQDNKQFFTQVDKMNQQTHAQEFAEVTTFSSNKYMCDLVGITQLQLIHLGLLPNNIYLGNLCTYCNNDMFYSYRKEKNKGRFASLIWKT